MAKRKQAVLDDAMAANILTSLSNSKEEPKTTKKQRQESEAGRFKRFQEERWDHMLSELLEFRSDNGDCLVPQNFQNPQLARWVKRQRRQYKLMNEGKASTMTPGRVKILEAEGFVWDSHEAAWKEKINDLRRFRSQHGHCRVPSNYTSTQLATWVKCQRRQKKAFDEGKLSAMNAKRIAELEAEGFVWEVRGGSTVAPPASAPPAPAAPSFSPLTAPSLSAILPADSAANGK